MTQRNRFTRRQAWSKTMLPEDPNANTTAFYDDELADHPGNKRK